MNAAAQSLRDPGVLLERIEANAPPMLLNLKVWLLHRGKQPFYSDGTPRRGKADSADDRACLVTFKEIVFALLTHDADGVGVALGPVPGTGISLCGIDLDKCFTSGVPNERARKILNAAGSYAERSPSGIGLHIIGLGDVGTAKPKDGGLEIYSRGRYFTVTGDALNKTGLADISEPAALARNLFGCPREVTISPAVQTNSGTVQVGGRNNFLISEAGKLRRIGLDPEGIRGALHGINNSRCRPPLPDSEVDAIAHGILRYEPNLTRSLSIIPDYEFVKRPPLDWLIKGILPRAEVAVVYGAPGSGKSFFAFDMCAAISTGKPWRGRKTVRGHVVFALAEGASGYRNRLLAYKQHYGELPGVSLVDGAPNLLDESNCAAFAAKVRATGPCDIIIIDTLAASSPGADENAATDMSQIVENCKSISRETGAMVFLVHHSGKDPTKGARGWSGLKAAVDAEIEISQTGGIRVARVTKLKDGEDGACFPFKLLPVVVGMDEDDEPFTSCVVEPAALPGLEGVPKLPKPGSIPRTVLDLLPGLVGLDEKVSIDAIVQAALNRIPEPAGRDTRSQHIKRALQNLASTGFVIIEGKECQLLHHAP